MSPGTAWVILIVAGLVEIGWALGVKYTNGWTRFWPSLLVITAYIGDLFLLAIPMRYLPAGTVYSVWVGIGSIGVAAGGILLFGESASLPRLACFALILAGVVGLKVLH